VSAAQPQVDLFRTPELGNSTFLVSDPESGEAVAIDPLRDVDQYLRRAGALGVRLTHSLETHVHNDFVSGSRELEAEVGAPICAAGDSGLEFPFQPLQEGSEVSVGRWRLQARARMRPGSMAALPPSITFTDSWPPKRWAQRSCR